MHAGQMHRMPLTLSPCQAYGAPPLALTLPQRRGAPETVSLSLYVALVAVPGRSFSSFVLGVALLCQLLFPLKPARHHSKYAILPQMFFRHASFHAHGDQWGQTISKGFL